MDLSGGKTSVDSLARLMANLAAEYAVDFQFDPFSSVAPDSMVGSEGFRLFSTCPVSVTDLIGSPGLHGRMDR